MKDASPRIVGWGLVTVLFMLPWCVAIQSGHGGVDSYITGRVVAGSSNRPMVAVWVTVYDIGTVRGRSLTGDDGRYYISRLDQKAYDVVVTRGQQTLARRQVRLPENTKYDIVIPP